MLPSLGSIDESAENRASHRDGSARRTDDFATATAWFRANDGGKRMAIGTVVKSGRRKKAALDAGDKALELF